MGTDVFDGKSVLVTGGTGSFSKSFIRTLLAESGCYPDRRRRDRRGAKARSGG